MPGLDPSTSWRSQNVAFERPVSASAVGGVEKPGTPTTVGTIDCRVRDITSGVRRSPDGATVDLALRLYTNDITTQIRAKDIASLTYLGQAARLTVTQVRKYAHTQQIDVEKKAGR